MKRIINLSIVLIVLSIFTSSLFAQEESNMQNRKLVKAQSLQGTNASGPNWVDADGDGICDNFGTSNQGKGNGAGKGYGLKDGSCSGVRKLDGTGFGKSNGNSVGAGSGTGTCDGTGNKGGSRRMGRK